MQKEEFYYDSRDGISKIHAVRYLPDGSALQGGKPRAVFQIIHGMCEYAERYEGFAEYLTDRGYIVTGEDHLGHGKTVAEGGSFGYFCSQDPATVVVRDAHRLKKMTQALYPEVPYIILGHSMGSFILRNYICRYGTGIQGAIIMGTGMQAAALLNFGKVLVACQRLVFGEKHKSRLLNAIAFGAYNKRIENPRTEYDWISRDEGNVDRYKADPFCAFTFTVNGFQTLFELISRAIRKENLEKVPKDLPVFILSGTDDPVGDYGEGVRRTYQAMEDAGLKNVQIKLYETNRHELLNEADREIVMKDICDWLEQIIPVAVS